MANMSDYLEVALLNATLNGVTLTSVNNPYISLWTSDPTDAGSGTEVSASGTAYARVASSFATASGTSGSVATDADATWAAATGGGFGTVGWIGLHDALTGGNLLYHTALDAAKTIDAGDVFKITTGNLTVTLA
jgi:hypothetical protein